MITGSNHDHRLVTKPRIRVHGFSDVPGRAMQQKALIIMSLRMIGGEDSLVHAYSDALRLAMADTLVMVGRKPMLQRFEAKSAAAHRTVALDSATVEVLRAHRRRQLEERMAAGPIWSDTGLVFTREDGSLVNQEWLTRAFNRYASAADLPWIGLHGLRHTHATLALKAGVPAKVVQERLGHSSVTIALDTYSHVLPNMQRDAAERVAELMFGP